MTAQTQLKFLRKNRQEVLKEEFRVPVQRTIFRCPICHLPMFVSIGQIIACHKECKKEYKRRLKMIRREETQQRQHGTNITEESGSEE